jgi:hypothetical protein
MYQVGVHYKDNQQKFLNLTSETFTNIVQQLQFSAILMEPI